MATIIDFEDLEIWQEARRLSREIIIISKETDLKSDFRLKGQINAAAGSVMDNIAEGFERDGNKEFRQFLSIAKASAGETRSQLCRLFDNNYIVEEKFETLKNDYKVLGKRIASFMIYLNKKDYQGNKYRDSNDKKL